jgi:aspartate/methionine/tyrosine aminotransferase
MEWVKTLPPVRYSLAISGVKNYRLGNLPVDFNALVLSGPGAYGYRPLVEALARKSGVPAECIVTAQGTSMANYLAMAALLQPGDDVLIEYPGYPLLWEAAQQLGAQVRFLNRSAASNFALDLNELEQQVSPATRLIVLTNLHNPSCALLDHQTLRAVQSIAERASARILIDEVYLDALFEDTPSTSFLLGPEFIVTNSLTKVYGLSGLRCGWIIAEPELAHRMYRVHDLLGVNNPYITDQISCVALEHLAGIAAGSKDLLVRNRAIANEFLALTPELEYGPVTAGTVLFPRLPVPVDEFCEKLRVEYDTIITPGRFFGAPDRVRMGYGGDTEALAEGLRRVQTALREELSAQG